MSSKFYPYKPVENLDLLFSEMDDLILYSYEVEDWDTKSCRKTYTFAQKWGGYNRLSIHVCQTVGDVWRFYFTFSGPAQLSLQIQSYAEIRSLLPRHHKGLVSNPTDPYLWNETYPDLLQATLDIWHHFTNHVYHITLGGTTSRIDLEERSAAEVLEDQWLDTSLVPYPDIEYMPIGHLQYVVYHGSRPPVSRMEPFSTSRDYGPYAIVNAQGRRTITIHKGDVQIDAMRQRLYVKYLESLQEWKATAQSL